MRPLLLPSGSEGLRLSFFFHCVESPPRPQGKLMGFDQTTNIILADSIERIFSPDEPVIEEPLGVEIVRGDNIVSSPTLPLPVARRYARVTLGGLLMPIHEI